MCVTLPASLSEDLKNFLELNLPKVKSTKDAKYVLGVVRAAAADALDTSFMRLLPTPSAMALSRRLCVRLLAQIDVKIGSAIQEATGIPCNCNDTVRRGRGGLWSPRCQCRHVSHCIGCWRTTGAGAHSRRAVTLRVVRQGSGTWRAMATHFVGPGSAMYFTTCVPSSRPSSCTTQAGGNLEKAQLGLSHSYSRAKVCERRLCSAIVRWRRESWVSHERYFAVPDATR